MIRQLLLTLTILAFAACFTPAMGQISTADTFKVVSVTAEAGTVVPIKLLVTNQTLTLMGLTAYFQIDTNVVRYVVDQGYVTIALVERGLEVDSVFDWSFQMQPEDSIHASLALVGDGRFDRFYDKGRGVIVWPRS